MFLDDIKREKWQDPEKILNGIFVAPDSTFVDVGCGTGFFTIPAAKMVGVHGKVYAVDSSSEALYELKKKVAKEGLTNIKAVVGKGEETVFCQACADIIFFAHKKCALI